MVGPIQHLLALVLTHPWPTSFPHPDLYEVPEGGRPYSPRLHVLPCWSPPCSSRLRSTIASTGEPSLTLPPPLPSLALARGHRTVPSWRCRAHRVQDEWSSSGVPIRWAATLLSSCHCRILSVYLSVPHHRLSSKKEVTKSLITLPPLLG